MIEVILLFFKGFGFGLAVAAPVGPVGALCIRKAVSHGKIAAITSGMGAALADSVYGCIAAFGLTAVSSVLIGYKDSAAFIGGLFLLWLAYKLILSARESDGEEEIGKPSDSKSLLAGFLSTFALTLTNPATILSFAAIFASLGYVGDSGGGGDGFLLVAGVFLGSTAWWIFLAFLATELKKRLGTYFSKYINIASAAIIGLFGIAALASLLFP